MSNLKRYNEAVLVQLKTLNESELHSLDDIKLPETLLNNSIVNTEELSNIDLQIDEENILKYLIENIDDDLRCAIKIYQEFKRINKLTLVDKRMWCFYSLNAFWRYTYLKYLKENKDMTIFKEHALLADSTVKSLIKNSISRLWWVTHMTRNPKNEDNYEITKFVFTNPLIIDTLLTLPQFCNVKFVQTFFEAYIVVNDKNWKISKTDDAFIVALYEYIHATSVFKIYELFEVSDFVKMFETFYEDEFNN